MQYLYRLCVILQYKRNLLLAQGSSCYSSNTDTCVRASAHFARICVAATPVRARARAPQDVPVLQLYQSGLLGLFLPRPRPTHPVSLGLFLATL